MLILGIEASAKVAGAAVLENGRIKAEQRTNSGLTHSETLLPMVDSVLKASGHALEEVDYIALTNGPGSFTGLRIGASTAKGLALGRNIPLIPVSTLEAVSYCTDLPGVIRVPMMDARRSQVYCAAYREGKTVLAPDTVTPEQLAEALEKTEGTLVFMGDASDLYGAFFEERFKERFVMVPDHLKDISAGAVCALAYRKLCEDPSVAIGSDRLSIEYLRKPQAVREREARLKAAKEKESAHE